MATVNSNQIEIFSKTLGSIKYLPDFCLFLFACLVNPKLTIGPACIVLISHFDFHFEIFPQCFMYGVHNLQARSGKLASFVLAGMK